MARPERFELPTFWFVVGKAGNPKALQVSHLQAAPASTLAVDSNLGWKGATKYVAVVPQVFDLWQDPQERYDIFMNNYTERTWMGVVMGEEIKKIMMTYVKYPPRKVQSYGYTGPITLSGYERFQWMRDQLAKEGVTVQLPTGN